MSRYQFDFEAHGRSLERCERIVDRLVSLFGVPLEEAVGRVNKHWQGRVFEDLDIICHEDEDFWANNIYFGRSSLWWLSPPGIKPLPYP